MSHWTTLVGPDPVKKTRMPELSTALASEVKEATTAPVAPTEKAVAKVKIDLKATKVNKKSVEFSNNNNNNNNEAVNNQNPQISSTTATTTVSKSEQNSAAETSNRDLSQVSLYSKFT